MLVLSQSPLKLAVGVSLLAALALFLAFHAWKRWLQPSLQARRPLRITQINIYPIKSCAGISLHKASYTRLGLQYDRQWMIVNSATGAFLSAREVPHLVLIKPRIDEREGTLTLTYPGLEDLSVPLSSSSLPADSERQVSVWGDPLRARAYPTHVSDWVTSAVLSLPPGAKRESLLLPTPEDGKPLRFDLVTLVSVEEHRRPLSEKFDWNAATKDGEAAQDGCAPNVQAAFSDGFPLLLASESSLAQLNKWAAPRRRMDMRTFRPNVVVNGQAPFAEDGWRAVEFGPVGKPEVGYRFWAPKPCDRCVLTTVDPDRGVRHESGEPLISLRQHRKMLTDLPGFKDAVHFATNLIQQQPSGVLRVGDEVRILERKNRPLELAPAYIKRHAPGSAEEKERITEYGM